MDHGDELSTLATDLQAEGYSGKLTAFDTDIKVPLVFVGPGILQDYESPLSAQNIDLRSTFDAMAGTSPSEPVDGRSLMRLFSTGTDSPGPLKNWLESALVEHRGPVLDLNDPDYQGQASANPPAYEALRLPGALYVEYAMGGREFYDLNTEPYKLIKVTAKGTARLAVYPALSRF